ncbi:Lrp/AsnC family transcriptional regulator [Luteococcus sp. H138]|uniref:Lrp/AsnC family transcriptional regulator n=1 Tax=unclassified Luteococcus TaxID=2639923 RepID=UPI00313B7496
MAEPSVYQLDETDRRILAVLDEDPRMPVLLLAQKTQLARGTVQSRLDRYRELGLLRLASTRIPPSALGCGLAATVSVELDQHQLEDAVAALRRIPEVLECFAPAGGTDLLCRVVARNPDDLYRVSEEIRLCPGILRTSTSVFLREVVGYRVRPLLEAGPGKPKAVRPPRLGRGQTAATAPASRAARPAKR